ncbi:hypothetical protein AVEN_205246-1 [Araneus ventricosus]|uniref:AP-5 complex subunit sigma-1 n=1 Tax=Araneus ventricosus TaxID=182803 RepID=A0A4Y2WXM8_ARAVE|nr:hypothetical protein AVEN_205246-1 [Araneus ventricosus]
MVNSFIIADLNSQVLYSSVFNFLDDASSREELLNYFVEKVKKEYDFNAAVSSNRGMDFSENAGVDSEFKGIFNAKVKGVQKPIVWHSYCGCLYILVCDTTENRILAASILFSIIRTLRDLLPKLTTSSFELVLKADVVSLIVNTLLPNGQLLFLNNQAMQLLIKDLQKSLR